MHVTNAVTADQDRVQAFFGAPETGPFVMVNLFKFKPRAKYADGSEPDLSGAEAYARYGAAVQRLIARAGGRIVHGRAVTGLMLGDVESSGQCRPGGIPIPRRVPGDGHLARISRHRTSPHGGPGRTAEHPHPARRRSVTSGTAAGRPTPPSPPRLTS